MNDSSLDNEDRIAQQAIEWCMRLHEKNCTEHERQMFQQWHDSNQSHARHYAEASQIWDLSGRVAPIYSHTPRQQNRKYKIPHYLSINFQRVGWLMLAVPVVMVFGWFFNYLPNHHEHYVTTDSSKKIILVDGSQVQLNTNTQVSFSRYRQERHIAFQKGEAYFQVAHNQAHPFIIDAGSALITVTGTEFNLRRYNDDVVVTVIDGSVNVDTEGHTYTLTREMQASYNHNDLTLNVNSQVNTRQITSWREGRLILDDLLLPDAINRINPYLGTPLIVDESAAKLRIGGIYNIANIKELPSRLPSIIPIRINTTTEGTLIISHK